MANITTLNETTFIRDAKSGDEASIHLAHMRSIREVCIIAHGEDEVSGWGNRKLGSRWKDSIKKDYVRVIVFKNTIQGVGYIKFHDDSKIAYIYCLYLTTEVIGQGHGKQLAFDLINQAKRVGCISIKLDSSLNACDFYQQLGFEVKSSIRYNTIGGSQVSSIAMKLTL